MNTEKTTSELGTIFDFTEGKFDDKKFFFVLTAVNQTSSYQDKKTKLPVKAFPNSMLLQMEVEVYDRKLKRKRVIRYVPGESIWKDEQPRDRERDAPLAKQYIEFIEGRKLVEGTDSAFVEFMMNDDRNESKPGRDVKIHPVYKLVEVGNELKKEIEKEMEMQKLITWCYTGEYDQVAAYARALTVSVQRDPAEVRFRMVQMAKHNPVKFKAGMNNPAVLRKHYMLKAIDAGVLSKDENTNSLVWCSTGGLLVQSPMGIDPIDFFVDAAASPKGEEAYNTVLSEMGEGKKEVKAPAKHPDSPALNHSGITMEQAEQKLDEAIAQGVIEFYGKSTYAFAKDQADQRKFTGKQAVILALKEEPAFYAKVIAKMS